VKTVYLALLNDRHDLVSLLVRELARIEVLQ
jgi:hypothetical protein